MRITALDIKGFGRLNECRIIPDRGFNIIYEANESGKSTVQAFIRAMLYGQRGGRRSKDGSLPPAKHNKPWNNNQYAGVMEYTLENGKSYRVGRNFDKGTVNIYDGNANNLTMQFPQDKDFGPRFAEEHLGIDKMTFERSAYIRQMQCAVDEEGRKVLVEKLSNLNTSGSEDISLAGALEALESALLEKVGTGRSTTRPLDRINMRLSELEEKREALENAKNAYMDTVADYHEKKALFSRLADRRNKLAQQKEVRRKARLKALAGELSSLQEEAAALESDLRRCSEQFGEFKSFEGVSPDDVSEAMILLLEEKQAKLAAESEADRMRDLQDKCEELKASLDPEELSDKKLQNVEAAINRYNESKKNLSGKPFTRGGSAGQSGLLPHRTRLIVIAGLLIAILMAVYSFSSKSLVFYGLGLLLALLSIMVLIVSNIRKHPAVNASDAQELNRVLSDNGFDDMVHYVKYRENQLKGRELLNNYKMQLNNTQKHLDMLVEKAEEYGRQLDRVLADCGINAGSDRENALEFLKQGVDSLNRIKEEQRDLLSRKESVVNKSEIVLKEAGLISGKAFKSADEFNHYLSELVYVSEQYSVPVSEAEPDGELQTLEREIRDAQLELAALKTRLEHAPTDDELISVIEEISTLQEKKADLELMGSSISLASQVLSQVGLSIRRDYIPELNREMSRLLEKLTGGRYREVFTNDRLQIQLEVADSEELIPVNRLSGGTIDQVYFCMRLAAVRLIERGREPLPLFLDEPFSQFDEERTKKAFELLKELSNERQIFLFSCRAREFELAANIFGDSMKRIRL